jgi:hypothetical protein
MGWGAAAEIDTLLVALVERRWPDWRQLYELAVKQQPRLPSHISR